MGSQVKAGGAICALLVHLVAARFQNASSALPTDPAMASRPGLRLCLCQTTNVAALRCMLPAHQAPARCCCMPCCGFAPSQQVTLEGCSQLEWQDGLSSRCLADPHIQDEREPLPGP